MWRHYDLKHPSWHLWVHADREVDNNNNGERELFDIEPPALPFTTHRIDFRRNSKCFFFFILRTNENEINIINCYSYAWISSFALLFKKRIVVFFSRCNWIMMKFDGNNGNYLIFCSKIVCFVQQRKKDFLGLMFLSSKNDDKSFCFLRTKNERARANDENLTN